MIAEEVRTRKLWNRKTILLQYFMKIFDGLVNLANLLLSVCLHCTCGVSCSLSILSNKLSINVVSLFLCFLGIVLIETKKFR